MDIFILSSKGTSPFLRARGWSVCSARMEERGSDLCPVQKQGVRGDKVVKELLYFPSSCTLRRAKEFPVCCAPIASKVARLSGLS